MLDYAAPDLTAVRRRRKRIIKIVIFSLLGVVVLPVLLLGMLAPSLCRSRETANRVKCASNERQIGQALLLYAQANSGRYPDDLETALVTQDISAEVFCCPSSNDEKSPGETAQEQAANLSKGHYLSYVYVGKGLTTASPEDAVLLYENTANHDEDGTNVLFADGHVEWIQKSGLLKVLKGGAAEATTAPTK
jgi:prepilin-type processing-associated H-X9-DG protein